MGDVSITIVLYVVRVACHFFITIIIAKNTSMIELYLQSWDVSQRLLAMATDKLTRKCSRNGNKPTCCGVGISITASDVCARHGHEN